METEAVLAELGRWRLDKGALAVDFRFNGFPEALAFLVRVGLEAERMDHHPELWNCYARVSIRLCTHDAGERVTLLDAELARRIERVAAEMHAR